jgi:hypothetical protein
MARTVMNQEEIEIFRRFTMTDWPEIEIKETLAAQFYDDVSRKVLYADMRENVNGTAKYLFTFQKVIKIGNQFGKLMLEMHAHTIWENGYCVEIKFSVAKEE